MSADRNPSVDVATVINDGPLIGYQKWLVAMVALTIVLDGIDNQLLGIVIPSAMSEFKVLRSAFAPVVSLGYVGMMIGGAVGGLFGDRIGRRTALLASMAVFGVMTLATSLVDSTSTFAVLRLLAGLGLGGAMPNAAALAGEYVPARVRPLAITITIICVPLGGALAGLLGVRALPLVGWRSLFVIGGVVPLVVAAALRWLLPESPQFLARRPARWQELIGVMKRMGRQLPPTTTFADRSSAHVPGRASLAALFTAEFRRDTIALWGAFFSGLLAVYLAFAWLTSLLTGAGFSPSTASTAVTLFNLGGVAGSLVCGAAISRFGSRVSMGTSAVLAIASATALSMMSINPSSPVVPILVMLALTGGLLNGVQTTMYALAAHAYPTAIRATGVGGAVGFGRGGAVVAGYLGSWAIDAGGAPMFFRAVAAMMLVTLCLLLVVTRHVPGARAGHRA